EGPTWQREVVEVPQTSPTNLPLHNVALHGPQRMRATRKRGWGVKSGETAPEQGGVSSWSAASRSPGAGCGPLAGAASAREGRRRAASSRERDSLSFMAFSFQ